VNKRVKTVEIKIFSCEIKGFPLKKLKYF
jgi:hypothetical protein